MKSPYTDLSYSKSGKPPEETTPFQLQMCEPMQLDFQRKALDQPPD
jgi:hypothetical protein